MIRHGNFVIISICIFWDSPTPAPRKRQLVIVSWAIEPKSPPPMVASSSVTMSRWSPADFVSVGRWHIVPSDADWHVKRVFFFILLMHTPVFSARHF